MKNKIATVKNFHLYFHNVSDSVKEKKKSISLHPDISFTTG